MLLTAIGLLFIAIFLSALAIVVYIIHLRLKYRHLPGPPCDRSLQHEKIFVVFVLHKVLVFVSDTSMTKEILTNSQYAKSKQIYKNIFSVFNTRCLGRGLLTETNHQSWLKRHNVIIPAFHKKYLTLFLERFNKVGDRWISVLNDIADGETVFDIHDYLCRVTLDAVAEIGFNDELNSTECSDNRLLNAIMNALKAAAIQVHDPLHRINPKIGAFRQTAIDAIKFMRSYGTDLIRKRRQLISSGQEIPQDILTHIIKTQEVDPTISDEILLDDLMTLLIAGQETTSNSLAFLFSLLGQHPYVLQRLQEEVDDVMGSRAEIEYEDLGKLEYCGQVFKEILRLYPVAPGTARQHAEDVVLDGYRIPRDTILAFSSYSIHRLPQYFEDPDDFRPERFASNAARKLYTYMPFSLGQRACAGQQFAKIEAKVLMCKFFQHFNFKLASDQACEILENTTLRPKGGVQMTLTRRK